VDGEDGEEGEDGDVGEDGEDGDEGEDGEDGDDGGGIELPWMGGDGAACMSALPEVIRVIEGAAPPL